MKKRAGSWVLALALVTCATARAGDHAACPPPEPHFLTRLRPVGGWNPGGGLLHWWDPHCFPRWCGPDDYCRKPFPNVCRPYCFSSGIPGGPQAPAPPNFGN